MAKVLLQNIIATLRRYQWAYCYKVNLNCNNDSLFFRHDRTIVSGESTPFCTISLNQKNCLRVINASENTIVTVRRVVEAAWYRDGIQNERDCHGSWEFKLSGSPWETSNKKESFIARYLLLRILGAMQEEGWYNIGGLEISQNLRVTDKSVLILQKCEPKRKPLVCLSWDFNNKLSLINASTQLIELFRQILFSHWSKGFVKEKESRLYFGVVYQMNLASKPWMAKDDTLHARSLLCNIFQEFMERGLMLFLTANFTNKDVNLEEGEKHWTDVHNMFFVYDNATSAQSSTSHCNFSSSSTSEQCGIRIPPSLLYLPEPNAPPPSYAEATGLDSQEEEN